LSSSLGYHQLNAVLCSNRQNFFCKKQRKRENDEEISFLEPCEAGWTRYCNFEYIFLDKIWVFYIYKNNYTVNQCFRVFGDVDPKQRANFHDSKKKCAALEDDLAYIPDMHTNCKLTTRHYHYTYSLFTPSNNFFLIEPVSVNQFWR